MAKEKKTISVLELPLYPEIWQADRINKKMENVARIYYFTRVQRLVLLTEGVYIGLYLYYFTRV